MTVRFKNDKIRNKMNELLEFSNIALKCKTFVKDFNSSKIYDDIASLN